MKKRHTHGFTLVELAVVILIITLLLGSLLVPLTSQVEQRNISETQKNLDEIREALIGHAMMYGRLPRPAKSATDGTEQGNCVDAEDCTGWIPWTTLGVARTDAWGHLFRYKVTPTFANNSAVDNLTLSTNGNIDVVNGAKDVPAVIVSFGANRSRISENGVEVDDGPVANADEDTNFEVTTAAYVYRAPSETNSGGGPFDDLVVWIPASLLFNRMVMAGRLP